MSHIDQRNADWLAYDANMTHESELAQTNAQNDFCAGWNQGWTAGNSQSAKTPAESRLIESLLAERNGVHSLPVKLALRAVRAEREGK